MPRLAGALALICLTTPVAGAELSDYLNGELAELDQPHKSISLAALQIIHPDGEQSVLAEKSGKVLLVNLWDRGCVPCRNEMPDLAALERDLGDERFEVVALPMNKRSLRSIKKTLASWGAANLTPYRNDPQVLARVLYDEGLFTESAISFVYPTTYLVDKQGRIVAIREGFLHWNTPDARTLIEAMKDDVF